VVCTAELAERMSNIGVTINYLDPVTVSAHVHALHIYADNTHREVNQLLLFVLQHGVHC
jgi:hypothetical protein